MDTIIIKPKNKEELELISTLMERMNISASVQKDEVKKLTKAEKEFLDSLPKRLQEVQDHLDGKIKLKDARALLDEI
jgi:DNA replication initiation complex subunit (GINS family)